MPFDKKETPIAEGLRGLLLPLASAFLVCLSLLFGGAACRPSEEDAAEEASLVREVLKEPAVAAFLALDE